MLHHVCNEHEWEMGECTHEPSLDPPSRADGSTIPYFSKDGADFEALQSVVLDKRWLRTLKYYVRSRLVARSMTIIIIIFTKKVSTRSSVYYLSCSCYRHTGCLESFHNVMLAYASKRISFR